jgi:fumarate reductase subunit C
VNTPVATERVRARYETALWLAQRASAAVLALCVVVHLATIFYAVRQGLSAEAILGRVRGAPGWAAFYGVFVAAAAVHAGVGLRAVLAEWVGWRGRGADRALALLSFALAAWGGRAVWAVIG